MAIPCDAGLLFATRDTAIGHLGVHASEFIKREGLIRGFHPFAPEENGPPLPQQKPSRKRRDTRRKQNDQRERQHEIQNTFLKAHHTQPNQETIPVLRRGVSEGLSQYHFFNFGRAIAFDFGTRLFIRLICSGRQTVSKSYLFTILLRAARPSFS